MKKSLGYYIGYFAICYAFSLIAVIALAAAMFRFAPGVAYYLFGGSASIGIVVALLIAAPMLLAGKFFRTEARGFGLGEGWKLALIGAGVIISMTVAAMVVANLIAFGTLAGRSDWRALAQDPATTALFVAIVYVVITLTTRLFMWLGMRNEVKRAGL